ncbi:MAG: metal-dependent hydrolase [Gemmatimonadetes bacterium]|nr:metal-dependent hydrolase [Gemmatimonadota bacterium]NNK62980.1 metal-dependent hydrolase [Gemmatimonadota bacterium]
MATLTWHGHATCSLVTDDGTRLVIDPFFGDNPATELGVDEVEADYILVTHGHFDHFADCIPLAKRTGAMVISTFEIVAFCQEQGIENGHGMNIGGGYDFPFGRVKMTPALHTGSVAGDTSGMHTTDCGGFLLTLGDRRLYHAGDTALIMDLQLLRGQVDIALLPIGDNFTMGPDDAARAVDFIQPDVVVPIHYSTWPVIEQDPEHFRSLVGEAARVEVLQPGGTLDF